MKAERAEKPDKLPKDKQPDVADYVAVSRISNRANETLAMPGERCERVPVEALASLAADGDIRLEQERRARGRKAEDVDGKEEG